MTSRALATVQAFVDHIERHAELGFADSAFPLSRPVDPVWTELSIVEQVVVEPKARP
jgi:hypothetical protein